MSLERLFQAVTSPLRALIHLPKHDGCMQCNALDENRAYYKCPECGHQFCGLCAVPNVFSALLAVCPKCKQRFLWPKK